MSDFGPTTLPDSAPAGVQPTPKKKSSFPMEILPVGCGCLVALLVMIGIAGCYFELVEGEERARRYAAEDRAAQLSGRGYGGLGPEFWEARAEEREEQQMLAGVCNGCGCTVSIGLLVAAVFVRKKRLSG